MLLLSHAVYCLIDRRVEQLDLEQDLVDLRPVFPAGDIMVDQPEIAVKQPRKHERPAIRRDP